MTIKAYPAVGSEVQVGVASDAVVASVAVPPETEIRRIWFNCDCIGTSISFQAAAQYGLAAYVLPVLDPDTEITPDSIWDAQVPKDVAVGSDVLDMDTLPAGADTTPEFEPGLPSVSAMVGLTTAPRRLYRRRRLVTFAKRAAGFESATPDTYIPAEAFGSRMKPRVFVQVPSYLLFGFSSPGTTATISAWFTAATTREWMQMRYLQSTIDDMYKQIVGLTETGAETPYEDAATLLATWQQQFLEREAGSFAPVVWTVFTECTVELVLHGRIDRKTFSVGGVT